MDINGIDFKKDGDVGIIMVHPPKNGAPIDYDPKLALQAIREEIKGDESIRLVFLTGQGDKRMLLQEIFEIEEQKKRRRVRRRRKGRTRSRVISSDRYLTHSAAILPVLLKSGKSA